MRTTKDDILDIMLKNVSPVTPNHDFTNTLMEQLQISVEEDLIADTTFSDLVNQAETDNPSANFTDGVISKLKRQSSLNHYQPLISKRTSLLFATIFLVLIVLSFITNNNSDALITQSSSFEAANNTISTFLQSFTQESTLIILCIISISALLCIDFIYKKRYL